MQMFHDFMGKLIEYCDHHGMGNEAGVATRIQRDMGALMHIDPEAVAAHVEAKAAEAVVAAEAAAAAAVAPETPMDAPVPDFPPSEDEPVAEVSSSRRSRDRS